MAAAGHGGTERPALGPWPARPPTPPTSRALAGTGAVVLAVAATKWGAYLGVAPIFPIDVLLAMALIAGLGAYSMSGPRSARGAAGRGWPGVVAAVLLLYATLRFAFGSDHGLTALRDLAPYGYLFVAFLSARSLFLSTREARSRTVRLIEAALLFHLAWVLLALLWPAAVQRMPVIDATQNLHLFSLRGATDATIVGITGALYLMRFLQEGRGRQLLVVVVSLVVVLTTPARAAVLATVLAFALTVLCFYCSPRPLVRQRRKILLAGALPALVLLTGLVLPQTAAGAKLLAGFGLTAVKSQADRSAIGTMRGRSTAWSRVNFYVRESGNGLVGVGFGADFLGAAGARDPLGNGPYLRSPHNYFVGTYARLGAVGLGLLLLLLMTAVREAVRCRRVAAADPLVLFAIVFPSAFLTSGAVGVELEAPFGAVPFFWCLGILLSRPQSTMDTRSTTDAPPTADRPAGGPSWQR